MGAFSSLESLLLSLFRGDGYHQVGRICKIQLVRKLEPRTYQDNEAELEYDEERSWITRFVDSSTIREGLKYLKDASKLSFTAGGYGLRYEY